MMRWLALWAAVMLGGCQAGYYLHLAGGHLDLMRAREPVGDVLASDRVSAEVRHKLSLSREVRDFAAAQLQLPVGDAYSTYVALDRDWVTWNLFAAPRLSLEPRTWCYPIVGCASYRGYFDRARAEREAARLRKQGLEVYAGGSVAYSTLGWFADPLVSPMFSGDDLWFAELLFHELVHRRVYIADDTRFNESLATAVARQGVRLWLAREGAADRDALQTLAARATAREKVFVLVTQTRQQLEQLYASSRRAEEKRHLSEALRWQLRARFKAAVRSYPELAGYRAWFDGPLNNAQLNTLADYEGLVPAFDALYSQCQGGWDCFWNEVERIAALPAERRAGLLEALSNDENGGEGDP